MSEQYTPLFSYGQDYDNWKNEYMPGYPDTSEFGNVTKTIPELKPPSYYSNYYNGLDASSAMFMYEADGKTRLEPPIPATEQQYRDAYASMNYFVNGGRTPAYRAHGINPNDLTNGRKLEVDGYVDKVVVLPNGQNYEYSHAPSAGNDFTGENATTSRSADADPTWTGDQYDGSQFNPDYAKIFPY